MDKARDRLDDPEYKNGFRDGRMDALLPRAGNPAPGSASDLYRAGYQAGIHSVRPSADQAA